MVKQGKTLPPALYTKSARIQSQSLDDIVDAGRVYDLFSDGATIVLQALHRYWEPLAHFCRDLESELTHPVQVNVYLTPPVSQGLDIHYDTHDVFVLQVAGVKHWKVWHSAFDSPLAHQKRTGKFEDPGAAQIDVEMKPGDALYIPRGFLHAAQTLDRESAHMTVGVLNVTRLDLLKRLLLEAEDVPEFRSSLPPGFALDPSSVADEAAQVLDEFASWVHERDGKELAAKLADKFWSARPPMLSGQLQQLLGLDALSDLSVVRRRRGTVCTVRVEDERLVMTLGDRKLVMPAFVLPAIDNVTATESFQVADLAPFLDEPGRLVLVRRLVREGLLEQVPSA